MSKQLVVGVESGQYTDKQTGEVVSFYNLHTVKHSMKGVGVLTDALWIDSSRSAAFYASLAKTCSGRPDALLCQLLDVSRDNRGYVEEIEILGCHEDAALFDF